MLDSFGLKAIARAGGVALMFDDGNNNAYSIAFQIMRARGLVGTFYVVSDWVGTASYMTVAQLQEMNAAGCDIGNHTKDHAYWVTAGLSQAQIQAELTACQTALNGWGLTRASAHVAYPNGESGATGLAAMTTAGMLTGRNMTGSGDIDDVAHNDYALTCDSIGNTSYLDPQKNFVLDSMSRSKVHALLMHHIVDAIPTLATQWGYYDFLALANWLADSHTPTYTISQLVALGKI